MLAVPAIPTLLTENMPKADATPMTGVAAKTEVADRAATAHNARKLFDCIFLPNHPP
jgi:hypothetical protein